MTISAQIEKQLRESIYGGNWTSVSVQQVLSDLSPVEAYINVDNCNSIASLTYHIEYYIKAMLEILQEGKLTAHDIFSYADSLSATSECWNALKAEFLKTLTP